MANSNDDDDKILASIDEDLFGTNDDESFDCIQYILNKFPSELNLNYIIAEKKRLEKQLLVVSRKLSASILEKETAYAVEMKRVMEIQEKLGEAIKICSIARKGFQNGKKNFTCASLGIVASYRRREVLRDLLRSLSSIKNLQETNLKLREMVEDKDYCAAIEMCIECQKAVDNLKHYKCVCELSSKLQELLETTEEHIDSTLAKMCHHFNPVTYSELQKAYTLLGKTQTSMDSLSMHFATAISDKAFSVVHGYVELCSQEANKIQNFRRKEYKELCKHITTECFIPCLIDLNKALWNIVLNYKRIYNYHLSNEVDSSESIIDKEEAMNRKFVQQKLEHGLGRVWQEIQQKLRFLIQSHDMSSYSFEELITILKISRKMMDIGTEFCGNESIELEETLHDRTVSYFRSFHKTRLDELRMYLENESWSVCPVKQNFHFMDLHEFQFLKPLKTNNIITSVEDHNKSLYFSESVLNNCNQSLEGPFDNICLENDHSEKQINKYLNVNGHESNDDEYKDEDKRDLHSSETLSNYLEGPIVTNTSLNVLRLIGKYMQIMFALNSISYDILLSIFHLFEYYLYTVYIFFCKEIDEIRSDCFSIRLKSCLSKIDQTCLENKHLPSPATIHSIFLANYISTNENLYGLMNRIVGIESLIFISSQFISIQKYLYEMISESKRPLLEQFHDETVAITKDLRQPGYMFVALKSINYDSILSLMDAIRWDNKEIPSLHNPYVDNLFRELQLFSIRLEQICQDLQVKVPDVVKKMLWDWVLKLANRTFVEGFSLAKKCTPAGRASMQLDYQQFLCKVEGICSIKPIPERELVEEYIKAYYLMDEALEQWILKRKEYTHKQLASLVNCLASEKKIKNKLVSLLDSKFENNCNSYRH